MQLEVEQQNKSKIIINIKLYHRLAYMQCYTFVCHVLKAAVCAWGVEAVQV